MGAALDKGLVSQAEYDDVKREYLRAKKEALAAKKERHKLELRAKNEALEAKKEALEFQRKELRAKEEVLEFQKRELIAEEEFQKRKAEADLRAFALESIVKHGSSIMSEEQKVDLVRDYVKMSGLDGSAEKDAPALKRQKTLAEELDASPPQPPTPPAAAVPPADAFTLADEDEYSNYSDDGGEDDSDSDEPRTAKRTKRKKWTEEDDAALVAALRAGQGVYSIKIPGRGKSAARSRLHLARETGSGSPALREYLEETCPEYVYKPPPEIWVCQSWSVEEDQTFIQAHREGKKIKEIAAMLPGRTRSAVSARWSDAKKGRRCSAVLKAYAAEYLKAAASQSQVPSAPRPRTGPPPLDDSRQNDQSRPVLLRLDVLEGAPEAVECRLDVLPVQSVPDEQRPDDE